MKDLRDIDSGCPWNREQTHQSLRRHLLEETYETLEAIDNQDCDALREELGDLFLQIVFHCEIADEKGRFDLNDIAEDVAQKMIRRHPHVFDANCELDSETSLNRWDEIKKQEKQAKGVKENSILDSVSQTLPALYEADKISKKVAKVGFDWQKPTDVFDKIQEEIAEVKEAVQNSQQQDLENELGDLLFSVANLCRVYKINPEIAMRAANQKFRKRFYAIEKATKGKELKDLSFEEWQSFWDKAKK